jgi:hypothetical protein
MYATAVFNFDQNNNGFLMSGNAFVRSIFLLFIFPKIIDSGRKWFARRLARKPVHNEPQPSSDIPTEPQDFDFQTGELPQEEPTVPKPVDEKTAYAFDLFFLRWSLLVDGALMAAAGLATRGWHMYLGKNLRTGSDRRC